MRGGKQQAGGQAVILLGSSQTVVLHALEPFVKHPLVVPKLCMLHAYSVQVSCGQANWSSMMQMVRFHKHVTLHSSSNYTAL